MNQATQNYLIGRDKPDGSLSFIKYFSIVGSPIERVGFTEAKVYVPEQVGIFDNGKEELPGVNSWVVNLLLFLLDHRLILLVTRLRMVILRWQDLIGFVLIGIFEMNLIGIK